MCIFWCALFSFLCNFFLCLRFSVFWGFFCMHNFLCMHGFLCMNFLHKRDFLHVDFVQAFHKSKCFQTISIVLSVYNFQCLLTCSLKTCLGCFLLLIRPNKTRFHLAHRHYFVRWHPKCCLMTTWFYRNFPSPEVLALFWRSSAVWSTRNPPWCVCLGGCEHRVNGLASLSGLRMGHGQERG